MAHHRSATATRAAETQPEAKKAENVEAPERQYGTRPQSDEEPEENTLKRHETVLSDYDDEEEEEREAVQRRSATPRTRILEASVEQRHGVTAQRKLKGEKEEQRCQCGVTIRGKTHESADKMMVRHLREFDPNIPEDDD